MKRKPKTDDESAKAKAVTAPDDVAQAADTDKVVDEITKHDSDELLKADDAKHHVTEVPKRHWYKRLFSNKKIAIPVVILVILAIVSVVPQTRYQIFGLFWKQSYALTVVDSQTGQPITSASVSLDGKTTTTDNHGNAHFKVKVGHASMTISKKYYADLTTDVLVPLRSHSGTTGYTLHAIGRQVPVTVVNKISGKPVDNATVKALDTEAKTDKDGKATIVLPAGKSTLAATIMANGYNSGSITIQVTTQTVKANDFQLTPAGKIYFLSKLSGSIDVVKTNLDGTGRQIVLAGTGNESDTGTVLLASKDWKYLVLNSVREANSNPDINLIDTSNDQVTNIAKGPDTFSLVGWTGDKFIYISDGAFFGAWEPGAHKLHSFDASIKKNTVLFQTTAAGSSPQDFVEQLIDGAYIVGDQVVYAVGWQSDNGYYSYYGCNTYISADNPNNEVQIDSNGATLNSINADGTNKKLIKTFKLVTYGTQLSISLSAYNEPNSVSVSFDDCTQNSTYVYKDGQLTQPDDQKNQSGYNQNTTTYLESPSGKQTFWSESRDGKNTLFIGDQNGETSKQIATLSDYSPYGWYTDSYLLVSKDADELYVMPVTGGTPLKITDYHKPAQNFYGYGGGYGGY